MSARFNVTRSSSDSQTYPPFAVHVDSETRKDRDQFYWSRSFAFGVDRVAERQKKKGMVTTRSVSFEVAVNLI